MLVPEATVSVRISKAVEQELRQLMREEHLDRSAAFRKLLSLGIERHRLYRILQKFSEGRVSLAKAAEEARVSIWEVLEEIKRRRIPWVADDVIEDVVGTRSA